MSPIDRQYIKLDNNGYIDIETLNKGIINSMTNSENLKSLAYIVNSNEVVNFYGLADCYQYIDNNTGKTIVKNFETPNRSNVYSELMQQYKGDEAMRSKYSEILKRSGIKDEETVSGNFGATLRPKSMQSIFPGGQISSSEYLEVYISNVGTTQSEQVKNTAHELYGHALFGLQGKDPRHGGATGRIDGNRELERHINVVEIEAINNNE